MILISHVYYMRAGAEAEASDCFADAWHSSEAGQ